MNATKQLHRPANKFETKKSTYQAKLETLRRKEVRKIKTSDFGKMK